ncbi:MAG: SLC13 family permease [Candidatus Lokiarchaeota archaeon]
MISAYIAPMMLVLIIVLIVFVKMNRLMAGFIGAIILSFFLLYIDKINTVTVVGFLLGVDNSNLHTILFIFGMMMIITVCKKSGVFVYIGFRLVQFSKGNSRAILVILSALTFIFSSISMNILTIFLVIPLTITICRILRINPLPFILSEGMVVNTGGLLFVISSIPNLLISRNINWTFPQYFLDVGFFSLYDAWMFVESKSKLYRSLIMLILTIASIIIVPLFSTITIDSISLGAGVITILLVFYKEFRSIWKELDLELIFYLFCILFISEAIDYTGILNFVSVGISSLTSGNSVITTLILLWVSGILSSVINNAPISKLFIPITNNLSTLVGNKRTLFSAVSIGTTLGENLSTMGDNLTLIVMVRSYGIDLTFSTFMKLGVIISLIQLISSSIFLVMKINASFFLIGFLILAGIVFILYFYPSIFNFIRNKLKFLKKE